MKNTPLSKELKKHKRKERLRNAFFVLKAYFKYFFRISGSVKPPKKYKSVFKDNFQTLDRKKWRFGQRWGDFHSSYLNQYYDTIGELAYVSNDGLVLEIRNKPKKFKKSELPEWRRSDKLPDEFTIPVGIGKVSSVETWQYGWFESWIKIPKGKHYWLAYWMTGVNSWPPEIDIFEAFSHNGEYYNSDRFKLKNFKIQPNLHYGDVDLGNKEQYGAYDVPIHAVTNRFVQYVCHWEKDFIRIYYDGQMVFETTNKEILKWFNREKDKMSIILGHGHRGFHDKVDESKMIVKCVNVYQK
jgi:beta-glucanase (GH16 family)